MNGLSIGLTEIFIFFIISYCVKKYNTMLQNINNISYYYTSLILIIDYTLYYLVKDLFITSRSSSLLYILPLLIIFHIMYLIFYSHQSIFKDNLLFGIPLLNLLWVILFTISFIIIAIREYNKSKETKQTIHQT